MDRENRHEPAADRFDANRLAKPGAGLTSRASLMPSPEKNQYAAAAAASSTTSHDRAEPEQDASEHVFSV
jgi:hypothetical protein